MVTAIIGSAAAVALAAAKILRRPKGGYYVTTGYDRQTQYGRGTL